MWSLLHEFLRLDWEDGLGWFEHLNYWDGLIGCLEANEVGWVRMVRISLKHSLSQFSNSPRSEGLEYLGSI